jgi:hypothetical protein
MQVVLDKQLTMKLKGKIVKLFIISRESDGCFNVP